MHAVLIPFSSHVYLKNYLVCNDLDMGLESQNLSLGFPTRSNSNQPAQLQSLAIIVKFRMHSKSDMVINKEADETLRIRRLVHLCCLHTFDIHVSNFCFK